MEFSTQILTSNRKLQGKEKAYECWEIRPRHLKEFQGTDLVCLVCYVTLPLDYHFFYGAYHQNLDSFKMLKFDQIVYSYCFIYAGNKEIGLEILDDLCLLNALVYD